MASSRTQQGFTMVELLVCIAIIAILAAMLLPAIHGGRGSLGVHCLSNQKQIAVAALMYQSDNKGALPNLDAFPGNDGPITLNILTNYFGNRTNLFMCPFVVQQREKERPWYRSKFVPVFDASFFRSNGNDYAYYDGVPTNAYTNAFIADRLAWTNRSASNLWTWSHVKGRINAAFVDGHAENLKADKTVGSEYEPAWSAQQDPIRR